MTSSPNTNPIFEDWRDRLDWIEQQQAINTQAIADLTEQLTITRQDHDRRMADHDRRMADHDRRMADHDRRMAEIDQRLARLTQLTERFVDQTLSHDARLTALERAS
ncbi:MAG: hypothetical protein ACFBSF_09395 [Leptolyngbyaceae cyanobacterium]